MYKIFRLAVENLRYGFYNPIFEMAMDWNRQIIDEFNLLDICGFYYFEFSEVD